MKKDYINIQTEDFDHQQLMTWLQQTDGPYGALVTFTGVVRDSYSQDLQSLFLEHYPGMTESSLASIIQRARRRWDLGRVSVVHRIGELQINDNIVFVGVVSAHRACAFQASQFIMDYLKKDAPFWKKETSIHQSSEQGTWVEQKASDLEAAQNWK